MSNEPTFEQISANWIVFSFDASWTALSISVLESGLQRRPKITFLSGPGYGASTSPSSTRTRHSFSFAHFMDLAWVWLLYDDAQLIDNPALALREGARECRWLRGYGDIPGF